MFASLNIFLSYAFATGLGICSCFADTKHAADGNELQFGVAEIGVPPIFPLDAELKQRMFDMIENWHFPYSTRDKLLLIPRPKPKFKNHWATDPMHSMRWSFEYAVICMDSGRPELRQRAFDILEAALPFQDQDPLSKFYGLWPDYKEIPIPEMKKVDRNSADFIGINLIQIRFVHGEHLPTDLRERVDAAILRAAEATMRRDVSASYTNPAMMSLVVTLVAGKAYQHDALWNYGVEKAHKILKYTKDQGSFTEYNSPNYILVGVNALQKVRNYIRDPEVLSVVDALYRMYWEHVGVRYHPPTGQWSGPHSRSYQDILTPAQTAFIDAAVEGIPAAPPEGELSRGAFLHRHVNQVPLDLVPLFEELLEPRNVVEVFETPEDPLLPKIVGTTWLTEALSLGTINRSDMWNQRRNLQAYWGTRENPAYLRLRFLKDDYDFASVNFFSQQAENRLVAALNFSTNGGDRHLFLDAIKKGTFKASDLRLRFEFGGAAAEATVDLSQSDAGLVRVEAAGQVFFLHVPVALFDGVPAKWESFQNANASGADVVLYAGELQMFDLRDVGPSVVGFGLEVYGEAEAEDLESMLVQLEMVENRMHLELGDLALSVPVMTGQKVKQQKGVIFGGQ